MKKLLTAALLGAALLTGTAGAVVEPTDAFYVADYADVLSEETEQYIIDQNEALFEATGGQIVVVAVDFMDGMDSADYAMAVAEKWGGIGDAERNNGFLLVYAVGENKVWAMAGAGIEDALSASTIEGWLEDDFYDGYDAGEYDSATRAFFDDVYGWYESYYATSSTGAVSQPVPDYEYLPQPENDHFYTYTGSSLVGTLLSLFLAPLIVVIIVVAILADGWRYRRYHRRYMGPGMPPPPYVYRPFIFGRPHRPRPPRPPRPTPLEVQAASYLAASARMVSLSRSSIGVPPKSNICTIIIAREGGTVNRKEAPGGSGKVRALGPGLPHQAAAGIMGTPLGKAG